MKLNDDTVNKLEQAFAIGADVSAACYFADISRQTYYNWIEDNKELEEKFDRLREKPALQAYQTVVKGLDKPEMARWYLERKKKLEFSQRNEIDVKNPITTIELVLDKGEQDKDKADE